MGLDKTDAPKSDIQQLQDDIFVDTSETPNLDLVSNNLGFKRPIFGWHRDDLFRAAVRKLAMTRHTPITALHNLCELVFGPDLTKIGTIVAGQGSPAIVVGTVAETFAITASVNDQLVITAQGLDPVQITLPTGGAVTAATVASTINAASTILQVTADTVTVAGSIYLRLTATGNIVGTDSVIRIESIPTSGAAALGLAAITHGHNDVGPLSYLVKMDDDFISTDIFPQLATSLYIDEHGPDEEILPYKFRDPVTNILALNDSSTFAFTHEKYLPAAASELTSAVLAGGTELNISDSTFFPTAAAPSGDIDTTFFAVIINRGGSTEEYINIQQRVGLVLTTGAGLQFAHDISESVEVTFTQDKTPVIDADTIANVVELTLDDSSIFPKAEFTIIVGKGTEYEETLWISENDLDGTGTSGTPNTLIIDGTQQATAPTSTAFAHNANVTVEPAQLQLKGCGWILGEARATGEIVLALPEGCVATAETNAFAHAYLHEELEPFSKNAETDLGDVTLLKSVLVGETSIKVDLDDLDMLWGGPTVPTGPAVQTYQDLRFLNRVVEIDKGGTIVRKLLTHVKESAKLVQILTGNVLSGYDAGDTVLQLGNSCAFIDTVPPFDVRINRGGTNVETKTVTSIDYALHQITLSAGLTNGHCSYDDIDTPGDSQGTPIELIELDDSVLGITLVVASEFETAIDLPSIVVRVVNTASDNFLYDTATTDIWGRTPPSSADNLIDGGWLPVAQRQNPQDGKYWGYFVHEPGDNQPLSKKALLATGMDGAHPEAIFNIPAPTEVLGYCTASDGSGFTTNAIPGGTQFIVLLDGRRWPNYAYPYPATLGKNTANAEIINVAKLTPPSPTTNITSVLPKVDLVDYTPFIVELLSPTTKTHQGRQTSGTLDGTFGDLMVIRVEQLLLDPNAVYFPSASGTAVLDFGYNSQEVFEFSSREGTALILDDHEFEFQHPVTAPPWQEDINPEFKNGPNAGQTTVHLVNKNYTFKPNGYDHPIHLPGDPSGILLGIGSGVAIVDYVRAAGIKIIVDILSPATVVCPNPALLRGAYEDWPVGAEGQSARAPSGEIYQYSIVIGRWLPTFWYGRLDADAEVLVTYTGAGTPGDETSETPASPNDWTVVTASGGTLTSVGGWYEVDVPTAAARAQFTAPDPPVGTTAFGTICRAEITSGVTGTDDEFTCGFTISLDTGEDIGVYVNLGLVSDSNKVRIVDTTNTAYSGTKTVPTGYDIINSTDRIIEVYVDTTTSGVGRAEVFVDHYLVHSVLASAITAVGGSMFYQQGDRATFGSRDVRFKNGIQFRIA